MGEYGYRHCATCGMETEHELRELALPGSTRRVCCNDPEHRQRRHLPATAEQVEEMLERHRQAVASAHQAIEQLGEEAIIDALRERGFEVAGEEL